MNGCRIIKVLLSHKTNTGLRLPCTFRDVYSRTEVALRFPNPHIKLTLLNYSHSNTFFKVFLKLDKLGNFQSKQEGINLLYFYVPTQRDFYIMGIFTQENENRKKTFNSEGTRQSYKKEELKRGNLKLSRTDKFKLETMQNIDFCLIFQ